VRYAEAFHQGGWADEYKTDYASRLTAWFDHCLLGSPLPGWSLEARASGGNGWKRPACQGALSTLTLCELSREFQVE